MRSPLQTFEEEPYGSRVRPFRELDSGVDAVCRTTGGIQSSPAVFQHDREPVVETVTALHPDIRLLYYTSILK